MPVPSPNCTIGGSATPQDVTAGASVSGALANATGVAFWGLTCVSTDELNSAATVNGSLSINQGAKTFAFTAPSGLGSKAVFQSTVGQAGSVQGRGVDVNGVVHPEYTTTFAINVLTAVGLRVLATNESTEQNPVFGWIDEPNKAIRAVTGSGGSVAPLTYPSVTLNATSTLQLTIGQINGTIYLDTLSHGAFTVLLPTSGVTDGMRYRFKDPNGNWGSASPSVSDATPHNIESLIASGTWPSNTITATLIGGDFTLEYYATDTRWNQSQ